ncbi:MSHA biogenesis protein MshJ [Shewanella sp. NIFS-20-20]|uniref:MSHA biogenesis protein MshJ n=1 Tax=Shewanella sp. NIFS-20-20 TaxID=2853806 RepID=UPI001C440879|nr:MSHA biogenesis protein MshJ [Shewanella sp. NIFS-20-20]MBV7317376.1 MSHA biogenesis protein MshJ [Shewanella sp. NIFS-20-20]
MNIKKWHEISDKFDLLTQRERVMIAVASGAILLMLFYLPLESYSSQYGADKQQFAQHKREIETANQQISLYEQRLAIDPNTDYIHRQQALEAEMSVVDQNLESRNIVPANHMPTLLSKMLSQTRGIEVLSFSSLTPVPLLQIEGESNINLYNHGVEMKLKGDYFAILNFVTAVESLPDKLYWQRFDYDASTYPKATVTIEFYTLSINKDFISVAN